MIRSLAELAGDLELDCDLCVVGSGAGGAMVARQAARAGIKVIVLEEGPALSPRDFTQREDEMVPLLFQDAGARATDDGAVTVLQGRGVGGSTVHNTNLCKRAPAQVLDGWNLAGWSAAALEPHYAAVEHDLHVSPLGEDDLNRNNAMLKRGAERLGWSGGFLSHNRRGCLRSGFCELGCSFDAKENALKILIPEAVAAGAEVYADCRGEAIIRSADRVSGVEARARPAGGGAGPRVRIRSRAVCAAGSAIGSARLLLASDLPDPHRRRGASLHLHPGAAVAGVFDDVIEAWLGIPQSYECTEQLRFEEGSARRSWIVPVFAHPAGLASMMPGFGAAHMAAMRLYPHLAALVAMLHDRSRGSVELDGGRLRVRYALSPEDQRALASGIEACAALLLAAGAREVLVPWARPLRLTQPGELARIREHRYRPLDPLLTSVHPMCTLPMARDPHAGVVDERGRHHQLRGLWVADGSIFPFSLGVPPQLTIYAAAHKIAGHIIEELL